MSEFYKLTELKGRQDAKKFFPDLVPLLESIEMVTKYLEEQFNWIESLPEDGVIKFSELADMINKLTVFNAILLELKDLGDSSTTNSEIVIKEIKNYKKMFRKMVTVMKNNEEAQS